MKWLKNLFSSPDQPTGNQAKLEPEIAANETATRKHGMKLDWEGLFVPYKLGRLDLTVRVGEKDEIFRIDQLIKNYEEKTLKGSEHVLITRPHSEGTLYCGESSVLELINAWKAAPLEHYDTDEITTKNNEFSLNIDVKTKHELDLFNKLYGRLSSYHGHLLNKETLFKRFKKHEVKDLVFLLDSREPNWDAVDPFIKLEEAVKIFSPDKIRDASEKRIKKQQIKSKSIEREINLPIIRVRNALTEFPHKNLNVTIKDIGQTEIRKLKPMISAGTVTPDSLVRYMDTDDWVELAEFLEDWSKNKITVSQLKFLQSLYRQNGIKEEIPFNLSKTIASEKISALYDKT